MSGVGVTIAAMMNTSTIAYFDFCMRNAGVTMPSRARKKMRIGVSNTRPLARMIVLANEKKSSALIICWNCLPVSMKKPQVAGSSSNDTQSTSDNTGPLGVPWGSPVSVGIDGPPAGAAEVEQTGPLTAGVGDVKAPIVLKRVSPPYPRPAVFAHLNGFVIVECIIDRTGAIRDAKVVRSSSGLFEQAALDAVQQWQFAPGTLHGKPVDTIFDLTVTFTISR